MKVKVISSPSYRKRSNVASELTAWGAIFIIAFAVASACVVFG